MNINHIVIILLVVILLFMTFSPRPKYYTFRRSPYRECEYGEMGCGPDSWAPRRPRHPSQHGGHPSRQGGHPSRQGGSKWNKEVKHRTKQRRGDERRQRHSNSRHRKHEPLVEGLAAPGSGVAESSDAFNPSCPPPSVQPQATTPGGAGEGPPYLSYDCLDDMCTQVPRATGTYWTKDCDGNCAPPPPVYYPGYPANDGPGGYPSRGGGPDPTAGPLYCPT